MPMPDIGLAPPPPVDVSSQMKPSPQPSMGGPAAGGPNLASIIAGLIGGQAPQLGPDITPQVMDVQPLLTQLARQVPALGPDVDHLNVELKSKMNGLPAMLGQAAMPSPGAAPVPPVAGQPQLGAGGISQVSPSAPPPPPTPDMGALDLAMQLEVKLPAIGQDDTTLMPAINGFIARMRAEVPKVVNGETESVNPPIQAAPTEAMLSKIPVSY